MNLFARVIARCRGGLLSAACPNPMREAPKRQSWRRLRADRLDNRISSGLAGSWFLFFLIMAGVPGTQSYAEDEKKGAEGKPVELNLPIPVLHGAKGVKLPYFDQKGKLQMDFSIDSAYRIDLGHLEMKGVKMQTYDESGKVEMMIDLQRSLLDLTTRIITSDEPVTIRRSDFEITGDTMQFDTQTKSGKMVGQVRMLIFNLSDMTEKGAQ